MLKIRQERKRNNWTQEYVAKKVGVTKTTIHDIELAKKRPSYEVLIKLENLFNLSHRDLLQQVPDENILTE